jgi:hypothetical protein
MPFLVSSLMSYFSYTCGVHFDVLTLPLCPPCYPLDGGDEEGFAEEDAFDPDEF